MDKVQSKPSWIVSVSIITSTIASIFIVIGGIWAALHIIHVVPKNQKIEHLEKRILELEGQKMNLENRLSKYQEFNGELNTILPPTWIPINGAIRIFGGQGLLSFWHFVEDKIGGLRHISIWISLPGSIFEKNEGTIGESIRIDMNGGERIIFTYQKKEYALDSLGGEPKKAQFAITLLDIKERTEK